MPGPRDPVAAAPPAEGADELAPLLAVVRAAGLDLAATLAIGAADAPLPTFGRASALGVVLGNTRALWPHFLDALAADDELAAAPDPLDRFTERVVAAAAAAVPRASAVFFAHVATDHGWLPIQALAERAGLATLAPSGLCVHPVYGPWIALRALVVLDATAPAAAPRPALPCDCAAGCGDAIAALTARGDRFDPRAPTWRAWADARAACPAGRQHAYDDDQLRYHYTRDRDLLRAAVDRRRNAPR